MIWTSIEQAELLIIINNFYIVLIEVGQKLVYLPQVTLSGMFG